MSTQWHLEKDGMYSVPLPSYADLQARIDAALKLCDAYNTTLAYKVRAALSGTGEGGNR